MSESEPNPNKKPQMTRKEIDEKYKDTERYQGDLLYDLAYPEDEKRYTPEEIRNLGFMNGLQKEYPEAFIEKWTENGDKYLIVKPNVDLDGHLTEKDELKSFIFSKQGIKTLSYFQSQPDIECLLYESDLSEIAISDDFSHKTYTINMPEVSRTGFVVKGSPELKVDVLQRDADNMFGPDKEKLKDVLPILQERYKDGDTYLNGEPKKSVDELISEFRSK
jgi:hypothetical protein